MDVLHKVNLHIFVQFQDYIAHTCGENAYGRSIYEYTQADIEKNADKEDVPLSQTHLYSLWICFRTAWIYGASKLPEGHNDLNTMTNLGTIHNNKE